jgi:hypothetical protein
MDCVAGVFIGVASRHFDQQESQAQAPFAQAGFPGILLQPGDGVPIQRPLHFAAEAALEQRRAISLEKALVPDGGDFVLPGTIDPVRRETGDRTKDQQRD